MKKGWKIAGWVGLVLVVVLFVQAGVLKLIGEPMSVEGFKQMGFPDWFRLAIGLLEVVGGVALLFRAWARYGAALLAVIMIGAVVTLLTMGMAADVLMPVLTLCALVAIGLLRKPAGRAGSAGSSRTIGTK
ncbi:MULTISPECIES: DoxX family protein [Paenibacillus]|uniref:DoxX family protein n=1 Tax=Paenibacillus TaxID=44249 RepID=UPI0022B8C9AE|nr:DoxX family protein [Paenibacillus caseinilyticus]MCZ8521015.1 DoxX family protein [Paenibacillus caseinilyticus]